MDIRSILVNVDLATVDSTPLRYAINLAKMFDAELIGVAADEPDIAYVGMDGGAAAADFYTIERTEIEKRLRAAEEEFRVLVPAGMKTRWRAFVASPVPSLLEMAASADLIVTGATTTSAFHDTRKLDLGTLVLGAGRPVLDVANWVSNVLTDKALIAWKDTREARRAVADALPLLKLAKEVTAITVSEGDFAVERGKLDDLLVWLGRHGITARGEVIENKDGFIDVIESTARAAQADLVVSGAYGHSRMREWLLGGVTRNLLAANTLNRFMSN